MSSGGLTNAIPARFIASKSRSKSSVARNRKTRPPVWLPIAASCSGVDALARSSEQPPAPPGGDTTTHLLSCSGW